MEEFVLDFQIKVLKMQRHTIQSLSLEVTTVHFSHPVNIIMCHVHDMYVCISWVSAMK